MATEVHCLGFVKSSFLLALGLVFGLSALPAATLERLTLDEMIAKSTAIVRARVTPSTASYTGRVIYTHFRLAATETYKGTAPAEVVVPGGTVGQARQSFAGAPELASGTEYVLFLWTNRAGMTQVIGLTQGLFTLTRATSSSITLTRAATRELMLDRGTGQAVRDETLVMSLDELKAQIAAVLGTSASGVAK